MASEVFLLFFHNLCLRASHEQCTNKWSNVIWIEGASETKAKEEWTDKHTFAPCLPMFLGFFLERHGYKQGG